MRVARYFVLWFVFIFLFTGAIVGMEYIEGYKIATTEYYGLRNLGFVLVIIPILLSSLVYPVIVLPLSWLIGSMRWVRDSLLLYALLYAVMWAGVGGGCSTNAMMLDSYRNMNSMSVPPLFCSVRSAWSMLGSSGDYCVDPLRRFKGQETASGPRWLPWRSLVFILITLKL